MNILKTKSCEKTSQLRGYTYFLVQKFRSKNSTAHAAREGYTNTNENHLNQTQQTLREKIPTLYIVPHFYPNFKCLAKKYYIL